MGYRVRIVESCGVAGRVVEAGSVVELPANHALDLLACSRGELVDPTQLQGLIDENRRGVALQLERENRRFVVVR